MCTENNLSIIITCGPWNFVTAEMSWCTGMSVYTDLSSTSSRQASANGCVHTVLYTLGQQVLSLMGRGRYPTEATLHLVT